MSPRLRYLSTTLALVAIGLGYALVHGWPARPAPRLVRPAAAARPSAPPPTAREILDRGAALSLTADQKARLAALDERWRKESAGVHAATQEAQRELSRFLQEQGAAKASLQEIQRRSAEYREFSQELRELRQRHAEAVAQVLTGSQQRKLAVLTTPDTRGGVR